MGLIRKMQVMGEERDAYVRLNNFEELSKDRAVVRFRAFPSEKVLEQHLAGEISGNIIVEEWIVDFVPNPAENLWVQAYAALEAHFVEIDGLPGA